MRQKVILWIIGVMAMVMSGFFVASPAQASKSVTHACNPCDCPHDNRENCQGIEFYAVYARETSRSCNLEFYRFNNDGNSRRVMRVTQREIDALPESVEVNTLVKQSDGIALYQLTSGEFQVNAGPDANNKIYVLIFNIGCPVEVVREGSYVQGQ